MLTGGSSKELALGQGSFEPRASVTGAAGGKGVAMPGTTNPPVRTRDGATANAQGNYALSGHCPSLPGPVLLRTQPLMLGSSRRRSRRDTTLSGPRQTALRGTFTLEIWLLGKSAVLPAIYTHSEDLSTICPSRCPSRPIVPREPPAVQEYLVPVLKSVASGFPCQVSPNPHPPCVRCR